MVTVFDVSAALEPERVASRCCAVINFKSHTGLLINHGFNELAVPCIVELITWLHGMAECNPMLDSFSAFLLQNHVN